MPPLLERRKISIVPLQISSPMAESMDSKQPIKRSSQKGQKQGFLGFFSCKYHQTAVEVEKKKKKKKVVKRIGWSGSLCNLQESSKVMQRPEPEINGLMMKTHPPSSASSSSSSSSSKLSSSITSSPFSSNSPGRSLREMHLKRFSGCYERHMIVHPVTGVARVPSLRRNVFPCSQCGEIFTRSESLELHQAVKHAVSELGPKDNSRNIVEIIFKSSWLKKQAPMCKIERILKIHHTEKTVSKFEVYRDYIKSKANKLGKKHPRCIADGNELLRFHCTAFSCSLGLNGSTNLCVSGPSCGVCSIIRDGFKPDGPGKISTMATSGRAHDAAQISSVGKERAMLVCRVIAGKVKKNEEGSSEECDSVAGSSAGVYSNLDELSVFDPKAILPCFVVIYKSL